MAGTELRNPRIMELFFIVVVSAIAVANYSMTYRSFVLPHKVSLYTVKPVLQYDRYMSKSSDGIQTDSFHLDLFDSWKTQTSNANSIDYHYMTPLQISKYTLGCYGAMDVGPGSHWNKVVNMQWKENQTSAKGNATILMTSAQISTVGSKNNVLSVCSCIDIFTTNTFSDRHKNKLPGVYDANEYDLIYGVAAETSKHMEELVQFCQTSAVPVYTTQYEGTVAVPALGLVGQAFILLSLVHSFDIYINRDSVSRQSHTGLALSWVKMALTVVVVGLYLWRATVDANQFNLGTSTIDEQSFRSEGYTQHRYTSANIFIFVSLLVVLLIEIAYEYLTSKARKRLDVDAKEDSKGRWKIFTSKHLYMPHSTAAHIVDRIGADVPQIIGFGLLGMSVLLQADVSSSTSVIGGALIIISAGYLQHVSNVVKIMYEAVCARLSTEVITELTLKDDDPPDTIVPGSTEKPADCNDRAKMRSVLQFFGWTRLYIFVIVWITSFTFFTIAHDSSKIFIIKNVLDGQVIYFVIAFVFASVGFDIVYELMPFMFQNYKSDVLRIYFVLAYLFVYNLNQFFYIRKLHFEA